MSTDTGGPLATPLDTAAAWGRTGEIPPHDDRLTYYSPGPPPWSGAAWTGNGPLPAKKSRVPLWLIGLGVAAVTIIMCFGITSLVAPQDGRPGPGSTTMPAAPPEGSAGEPAVVYTVGKAFRSGDFQYTVHKVKSGITEVGNEYLSTGAQGSFVRLDVTVKNVSTKPRYFDTDLRIKVEDNQGRQFSSDAKANLYGNTDAAGWFTEINPGNEVRAFAYFDLPKNVKATRVVISAGLFDFEQDAIVPIG